MRPHEDSWTAKLPALKPTMRVSISLTLLYRTLLYLTLLHLTLLHLAIQSRAMLALMRRFSPRRATLRLPATFRLLATTCASLVLLCSGPACSSESAHSEHSSSESSSPTNEHPRLAENGAPFRVLIPRAPLSLDPRFVTDPYGLKISRLLHRGLFRVDPLTLATRSDLAVRFTLHTSDTANDSGGVRLEVELPRGLRFSDGSALTSEDVKATFDALRNVSLGSPFHGMFSRISQIRTPSETEVHFIYDEAHATILSDLTFPILPAEHAASPRVLAGTQALPGLGGYILSTWTPARLTLSQNPHASAAPSHTAVTFILVRDDMSRVLRMRGGGADLMLNGISGESLEDFATNADFQVLINRGVATSYLGFQTERIQDLALRQAIAHAIDRQLLIEEELHGRAVLTDSWIPEGHWADLPGDSGPAFDLEQARALLQDAEVPERTLILRTSTDRSRLSICRAIAYMLRAIGLDVEVRPSEQATLIADLAAGRFDMTLLQVPEVTEPHVLSWFFASDRIPTGEVAGGNRWRLRDRDLDEALERGRRTLDLDGRRQAYHDAQRRLSALLPTFALWQEHNTAVLRAGARFEVPRDGRFGTL